MMLSELKKTVQAQTQAKVCDPCVEVVKAKEATIEKEEYDEYSSDESLWEAIDLLERVRLFFITLEHVKLKPHMREEFMQLGSDIRDFVDEWVEV